MGDIFKSPIPNTSGKSGVSNFTVEEYLLKGLRSRLPELGNRPWLVDTRTGKNILFKDIEYRAKKIASGLARHGLVKGDHIQIVTTNVIESTILQIAAWIIGGITRNCCTTDAPEELARQMSETKCKFVVANSETIAKVKETLILLDFECTIINIDGKTNKREIWFDDLDNDDGSALPNVYIDGDKDAIFVCNTSGSTGHPKAALHTHSSVLCTVACFEGSFPSSIDNTGFLCTNTYTISHTWASLASIAIGLTIHSMGNFQKEYFIEHLLKFKPKNLLFYPYIAIWFARELENRKDASEFGFIRDISIGGAVLDVNTVEILQKHLPNTSINQTYATTECLGISRTFCVEGKRPDYHITEEDEKLISNGILFPNTEAKVLDIDSGELLGKNKLGRLFVRSKSQMQGYLSANGQLDRSSYDEEGWYDTCDMAFFDSNGQLFIRERVSFIFKYYTLRVIPSEIEGLILEHPAVQMVCVVGIPNVETNYLAKAFVVLKKGQVATGEELKKIVAEKLPSHKHLHAGVEFVESLPENRGGKMDRIAVWKKYCKRT